MRLYTPLHAAIRQNVAKLCTRGAVSSKARFSTPSTSRATSVNIVEVGPRDGLQNERGAVIPAVLKTELINRLVKAGLTTVEAGSFVSPKWVPQMAGTPDVLKQIEHPPNVHYPVLVPNRKGLEDLLALLDANPSIPPLTDEVAIFTASTDQFTGANLNCTVKESIEKLRDVSRLALDKGLRVRGYVSVVIACPYAGKTDYKKVKEVAKELYEMGCYEVSLGDTVGQGRPHEVGEMIEEVKKAVGVEKLAGHFHDTFGTGVANVMTALDHGIRTFDSSVGGLGGCPYSPGATGNVATEDVLYALQESGYRVEGSAGGTVDLEKIVDIGWWISDQLGRKNVSRVARAMKARRQRRDDETKTKL